tara:strand:- start:280 stop:537 length:258 start_codon:yes stop_codon:yes gene_type:complete
LKKIFTILLIFLFFGSCDKNSKCNSCGDVYGGFITMKVTASDLTKYEGLAQITGIDVGTCIQAYLRDESLFLNSVQILDQCCCEL